MPTLLEKINSNPQFKRAIPLLVLLAIVLVLSTGLFGPSDDEVPPSRVIGYAVNDVDMPMLLQEGRFTSELWRNKVVVVNFFASWCESCLDEHAALMKLSQSGKVTMLGIAWKDKPEDTLEWLEANGNPFHYIGLDDGSRATIIFGLSGTPETFILGPDSKIAYNYKAPITEEMVDTVMLPLIDRLQNSNASYRP